MRTKIRSVKMKTGGAEIHLLEKPSPEPNHAILNMISQIKEIAETGEIRTFGAFLTREDGDLLTTMYDIAPECSGTEATGAADLLKQRIAFGFTNNW